MARRYPDLHQIDEYVADRIGNEHERSHLEHYRDVAATFARWRAGFICVLLAAAIFGAPYSPLWFVLALYNGWQLQDDCWAARYLDMALARSA